MPRGLVLGSLCVELQPEIMEELTDGFFYTIFGYKVQVCQATNIKDRGESWPEGSPNQDMEMTGAKLEPRFKSGAFPLPF